jgi:soluble lytic murein transglycosylase-like protein
VKVITILLALFCLPAFAQAPAAANKYRGILTREAHFVNGLNAPVPMYAAQIEQESGWNPGITAWDNGRGLAQFMDGTADTIVAQYPDLGKPQPYNATWAIRALVRYDTWLGKRVQGADDCQRRAAALKAYNAGLGFVQQAQRKSDAPAVWFGIAEWVPTKQSAKNFEASRMYPRWVLFDRQPHYQGWGMYTCEGFKQ